MPQLLQPALTGGELTPKAHGRVDLARWGISLRRLVNFFVQQYGGVSNRAGTKFIQATKDVTNKCRLRRFEFSSDVAYALEFGDLYLRVFLDGAQVGPEIVTVWPHGIVDELRFTQSGDIMTLVHNDFNPYELQRTALTTFSLVAAVYSDGPFQETNLDDAVYMWADGSLRDVVIEASSATFTADMVGALVRIDESFLQPVEPWEVSSELAAVGVNPVGLLRRFGDNVYQCVTDEQAAGNPIATGTIPPVHTLGVENDGDGAPITGAFSRAGVAWAFRHGAFGIARITAFNSTTSVDATVETPLPDSVIGGLVSGVTETVVGSGTAFVFSGGGGLISDDPTDYYLTVDGVEQNPATYTVDSSINTITLSTAVPASTSVFKDEYTTNKRSNSWALGAWSDEEGFPSIATHFSSRLILGASINQRQTLWASKADNLINFGISSPLVDDDSLQQTLNAQRINSLLGFIGLNELVSITAGGTWLIGSGLEEPLTPSNIGFKPQTFRGAANVIPETIGESGIYVQKGKTKIRDLEFDNDTRKFGGNELTLLAEHLFTRTKTIVEMAYAEEPHGVLWIVRSDGKLISLTYLKEHNVIGWAQHETDGLVESITVVNENDSDVLYMTVARTMNSVAVRYIERMDTREFDDQRDAYFVDAGVTHDGRNTTADTVTLTTAGGWTDADELTATFSNAANPALVDPTNIDDEVFLYYDIADPDDADATIEKTLRCRILSITSASVATVLPDANVPVALQTTAQTRWALAIKVVSGFLHLQGPDLAVLTDGTEHGTVNENGGTITLDYPAAVVHAGLPYTSELETLEVNNPGRETIRARNVRLPNVGILVDQSRGLEVGPDKNNLDEAPWREVTDDYDVPPPFSGLIQVNIVANLEENGRFIVRQSSPLPTSILSLIADTEIGEN